MPPEKHYRIFWRYQNLFDYRKKKKLYCKQCGSELFPMHGDAKDYCTACRRVLDTS